MLQNNLIPIGSVYCNASRNPSFIRGIYDAENGVRCLKAEQHDTSVVLEVKVKEATKQGYSIARGGGEIPSTSRCREARQEEDESG